MSCIRICIHPVRAYARLQLSGLQCEMRLFYVLFNLKRAKRPINFLVINLNLQTHPHQAVMCLIANFSNKKNATQCPFNQKNTNFEPHPLPMPTLLPCVKVSALNSRQQHQRCNKTAIYNRNVCCIRIARDSDKERETHRGGTWL